MKETEKIEDLNLNGLRIIQDYSLYNFTCDSVLLSSFVKIKHIENALEIGTGSGIISILVNEKNKPKKIVCFEIQNSLAKLAERNFKLNNISNIELYNDDIKSYKKYVSPESFDVVFSNPPYKKKGSILNQSECKTIARHEVCLELKDLIKCSFELLKYNGKAYFSFDADRSVEMIEELIKNNLQPKEIQFCYPALNKNASLVFIKAVKGGKSGVKILPPIITNDENGKYIETLERKKV